MTLKDDTDEADQLATRELVTPLPRVAAPNLISDRGSRSGCLEVRCPSCHTPAEVAVDTSLTDLTCGSCGSHYSLVNEGAATQLVPSLAKMGRFELVGRLGMGAFGAVWKARDKELDRTVAIKIPRQGDMTAEQQEKFFREARAAAQLCHPHIVSVYEVGRDGDSIYIVSEFVRGVTLGDWLTGQQVTSREAAELCAKIADALHHAHEQGVVHRDLKPANIMMDYEGQPHLMDFGLARRETGEVTMTMDGQVLGTPAYMSPEQAEGEGHKADRRSDVYSLGVILFQLLTGELPFRGNARMLIKQVITDEPPSPRKLNANIPRDLETVTLKCLEKDPAKRYPTAREFAEELRRFLAGEPIFSRPIGRAQRAWRWCQRRPATAGLTAAVAALLLFVAIAGPVAAIRQAALRRAAEANEQMAVALQSAAERSKREAQQLAKKEAELRAAAEEAQKRLAIATQKAQEHAKQEALARESAEVAQKNLGDAKQRADRTLYARTISLAYQEWLDDNVWSCEYLLDSTRPEFRDWEWDYVKHLCHTDLITLRGPQSIPYDARFHKDGIHVVSCSRGESAIFVWNSRTGELVTRHDLNGYAVSGDGAIVAGSDSDGRLRVVDTLSGKTLTTIDAHRGGAVFVDLDANGSTMVTTGRDNSVKVWEVPSGKLVRQIDEPGRHRIHPVAISPDGKRIAWKAFEGKLIVHDGWLVVHDAETGKQLYKIFEPVYHESSDYVAFSADGKRLGSTSMGQIHIRDANTGRHEATLHGHRGLVFGFAFDPSTKRLASCGYDGTVRVWDIDSRRELFRLRGHKAGVGFGVYTVAFHDAGTRIMSGGADKTIKIWDGRASAMSVAASPGDFVGTTNSDEAGRSAAQPDPQQAFDCLTGHTNFVMDAAFAPSGDFVVTAGADGTVKVFDVSGQEVVRSFDAHGERVAAVAVGPDGATIASGSGGLFDTEPGTILIWSRKTGEVSKTLKGHASPIKKLRFLKSGKHLVSISGSAAVAQGELIIWDLQTAQPLHNVKGNSGFSGLDVTTDGGTIATCSEGSIQLWNAESGQRIRNLGTEGERFTCLAFSPDNMVLAAGNVFGAVVIFDAQTGATIWKQIEHTGVIFDVSFTPNGKRLISCGIDASARLWDAQSGDNLLTLRGHALDLYGARMSPDEKTMLCFGADPYISMRTIAERSTSEQANWQLILADDFDREALGDEWKTSNGTWSIENKAARGVLAPTPQNPGLNAATLVSKRWMPSAVDISYDAWSPDQLICETKLYDEQAENCIDSLHIGVFSPFNRGEKGATILLQTGATNYSEVAFKRTGFTFEAGRKYRFRSVRNGNQWQMYIDGQLILEASLPPDFHVPTLHLQGSFGKTGAVLFIDNLEVRVPASAQDEIAASKLEHDLFQELQVKALVLDALQKNAGIPKKVRELASRLARLRREDSDRRDETFWKLLTMGGADRSQYRVLLEAARQAVEGLESDWKAQQMLAAASYRAGDLDAAKLAIQTADTAHRGECGTSHPVNLALLALASQQAGDNASANEAIGRLIEMMRSKYWQVDPQCIAWQKIALETVPAIGKADPARAKDIEAIKRVTFDAEHVRAIEHGPTETMYVDDAVHIVGRSEQPGPYDAEASVREWLDAERLWFKGPTPLFARLVRTKCDVQLDGDEAVLRGSYTWWLEFGYWSWETNEQLRRTPDGWKIQRLRSWLTEFREGEQREKFDANTKWSEYDDRIEMARKEGDSRKLYELLRRGFRSKEACAVAKQVTEFPDATAEDWFSRGICAYFARDAQDMRFAFDKAVTMDASIAGPPFVRAIAAETHLEKHRDLGNGIRVRIPRFFAAANARDVNVPGEVLGAWYPSSSSVAVVFYVRNEGQSEKTLESWKNEALQRLSSIGGHLLRESEQSVAGKPAFDFILEANGTGRSLSGTASANPNTIQRWVGVKNSNDMIFFLTSALRNDFDQRNAEFEVVLSTLDFAGEKRPSADSMMDGLRQKCRASAEGVAEALAQSRSIPLDEPMSPFHQLVLGELRILDEKPQDAALLISKAIATGGREVYFQKSLGWALWRANRRTEAGAAFEKAIGKTKLEGADLDQWIAAYFLDRATEKEFVDRASGERNVTAAFAWFYIGQRKESDGSVADAIAAYQKSLAAADEHKIHSAVSNFAAYRLAQLETHAQGKSSSR